MRVTEHNGRTGKDGAYSAKHNDRNFDTKNADHIDENRASQNRYWHFYKKDKSVHSFEDAEAKFYADYFGKSLAERNQRYMDQRHPERVRTMDEYRRAPKTCPEETIYAIGKAGDSIDAKKAWEIVAAQIRWEQKTFPNVILLNVALHCDEEGAPHVHARKVWIGHDKDGNRVVGQSKALAEMGIKPPKPEEKYGRYNNAKMTYTRECREHFFALCREHGLEIEEEPQEKSKTGLSMDAYKSRQEREKAAQAVQEAQRAQRAAEKAQKTAQRAKEAAERAQAEKGIIAGISPDEITDRMASYRRTFRGEVKVPEEDLRDLVARATAYDSIDEQFQERERQIREDETKRTAELAARNAALMAKIRKIEAERDRAKREAVRAKHRAEALQDFITEIGSRGPLARMRDLLATWQEKFLAMATRQDNGLRSMDQLIGPASATAKYDNFCREHGLMKPEEERRQSRNRDRGNDLER